ncbi:MAG: putative HTH transcriptional regulator [Flammeovirgaceae bacterium]|jgi:predicted HTH transcriptional regulator
MLLGCGVAYVVHQQTQKNIALKISDRELLEMARENGGQLSKGFLVANTELTAAEATTKINELVNSGILQYKLDSSFRIVYQLEKSLRNGDLPKKFKKPSPKISLQKGINSFSDGDIISLAVKKKGRLSAASLCMETKISVDEADKKLKDLQEKGVFEIQVNENGTIVYALNDLDLLEG